MICANYSDTQTNNTCYITDVSGQVQGLVEASDPGLGVAWGDLDGDGLPELAIGTQLSTNPNHQGIVYFKTDGNGNYEGYGGNGVTFHLGDGVAIGPAGNDRLYIGNQAPQTNYQNGCAVFQLNGVGQNPIWDRNMWSGANGGGVAYGTNVRGNGAPGVLIGMQIDYGWAQYWEYSDSAGWNGVTNTPTWDTYAQGTAIGDIHGAGISDLLDGGGPAAYDFQYNSSTQSFNLIGIISCGQNPQGHYYNCKSIAVGAVTSAGAREIAIQALDPDSNELVVFLFACTGSAANYTLENVYHTGGSGGGSDGVAIISASAAATSTSFPVPSPETGLILVGADNSKTVSTNTVHVFNSAGTFVGEYARSPGEGHGLAYGVNSAGVAELLVGTNDASTLANQRGAQVWTFNNAGNQITLGPLIGSANCIGDGVALCNISGVPDSVFIGTQQNPTTGLEGAMGLVRVEVWPIVWGSERMATG